MSIDLHRLAQCVDVHGGQRRRHHAFTGPGCPAGIEGTDRGECRHLEHAVGRRPNPPLPSPKRRQAAHHRPRLLGIGVALHPVLDRLAVLRAGQLQRDQRSDLRQHVFVDDRRSLGDHERSEPLDASAPHDLVEGAGKPALLRHRVLRADLVGFVDDEMQRRLVQRVELLQERGEEFGLLAAGHLRRINDGLDVAARDSFGYALAGIR
ncbi:hypothetical protein [Mesorhizobium sp. 128a]